MTISSYPALVNIASTGNTVKFGGSSVDAFGRFKTSQPYTLFDSQNRYQQNKYFDTSTATGGSTTYLVNESTVRLDVSTASGSEVVRQTYKCFPYQPGKSLLVMNTFALAAGKTNLRQRVGYFSTQNGVFLEQLDGALFFVLRSYATGSVVETRIPQASWNVDPFNGTGDSGITIDVTKTQILWQDFEWLGVGSVRCGFVINGINYICHQFNNANSLSSVYMTTAILPIRYEITNTGITASVSSLKQICSTVISEGGYEKRVAFTVVRRTTSVTGITTTFVPLISIRLATGRTNAIVIPDGYPILPLSAGDYEVVMVKNATLTGASYVISDSANVEYDISATSFTGGEILEADYIAATNQSAAVITNLGVFNFDLQMGSSIAGVSDTYTIAVRSITGTNSAIGSFSFYDLT